MTHCEKIPQEALDNIQKDWEKWSGEKISVKYIDNMVYGFGSELAVLRLFRRYNEVEGTFVVGNIGFVNFPEGTHFFCLKFFHVNNFEWPILMRVN